MARIEGISDADASLMTRQIYKASQKRIGKISDPLRLFAHSPPVMFAVSGFEFAWGKANSVDPVLMDLCQLKVSAMIGCEF